MGEDHAPNTFLVAVEAMEFFAGRDLPKPDAVVLAAGQREPAVRLKGYPNDARMTLELPHFLAGLHVPKPQRLVQTSGQGLFAVGR